MTGVTDVARDLVLHVRHDQCEVGWSLGGLTAKRSRHNEKQDE